MKSSRCDSLALLSLFIVGLMNYSSTVFAADEEKKEVTIVEYNYLLIETAKEKIIAAGSIQALVNEPTPISIAFSIDNEDALINAKFIPSVSEKQFSVDTRIITQISAVLRTGKSQASIARAYITNPRKGESFSIPFFQGKPEDKKGEFLFSVYPTRVEVNYFSGDTK